MLLEAFLFVNPLYLLRPTMFNELADEMAYQVIRNTLKDLI